MKIKVYSTATCGYCNMLKKYLNDNNVEYEDARVDIDQDAAREMIALSGQMGVPFSVITKDDGDQVDILGFDQPKFKAALDLE